MRLLLVVLAVAALGVVGEEVAVDSGGADVAVEGGDVEGRAWSTVSSSGKVFKGNATQSKKRVTAGPTRTTVPVKTSKPHRTKGSGSHAARTTTTTTTTTTTPRPQTTTPRIETTTTSRPETTQPPPVETTLPPRTEATPSVTTTEVPTTPTPAVAREEPQVNYYPSRRPQPRPPQKVEIKETASLKLPGGAPGFTKPTKYHYYPHNQHIYLLPECAIQQVCNAVYVRLNFTQPLCACPSRHREPCSASLRKDDLHTTELSVDPRGKALTLVKTCEPTSEMRVCKEPRDWSLLALQNVRTGKSHYLVLCRCPKENVLEGPMNHDQPSYASVPGIRVYGMMCVQQVEDNLRQEQPGKRNARRGRQMRLRRSLSRIRPAFPWSKVRELAETIDWEE